MAAGTPMKAVGLSLPMETYDIAARMARDSGLCVGTKIRQDLVDLYAKAERRRRANMNSGTDGNRE